ncbi:TPA_asm: hypothetical protein GHG54_08730 [Listeria monocytogenes]|nr:hypothetical protein [Listeria monocytogenes]
MERAGFYFIASDDDAASLCPRCGEPDTSAKALAVFESIDVNNPVHAQCVHCRYWYNIGGIEAVEGRLNTWS